MHVQWQENQQIISYSKGMHVLNSVMYIERNWTKRLVIPIHIYREWPRLHLLPKSSMHTSFIPFSFPFVLFPFTRQFSVGTAFVWREEENEFGGIYDGDCRVGSYCILTSKWKGIYRLLNTNMPDFLLLWCLMERRTNITVLLGCPVRCPLPFDLSAKINGFGKELSRLHLFNNEMFLFC